MVLKEKQLNEEKADKIKHYSILNQYVKKGEILFTGSSLMEQFPIYEFMQDYDIRETIYNRGASGFTSSEMILALDTLIFELEPRKIFINIGTNDLSAVDYTLEELTGRYEYILNEIKEHLPKTKIYVMAYYPCNCEHDFGNEEAREWIKQRSNEKVAEANEALKAMAERYQVKYIDISRNLYDRDKNLKSEYSVEGVHMYANGYRAILDELMEYVRE
ncbi:GDSL-type esterase/lipase family protein [Anaerocolumna xylanovorans]|uniref:Lysophospholipase L1 n=1 Tax=Anaerocolumna xylanovorans DSM 12503 TaxID=1121345 RepID=A0A1M7Y5B2_9FIRM|nr:GDSL-type esterase/lipase family protein [Anaerocolumna xylanovorans]SHO47552.1 Lysophospholipase L1 [Anaerocolumna xylanovorans DSM 12503]